MRKLCGGKFCRDAMHRVLNRQTDYGNGWSIDCPKGDAMHRVSTGMFRLRFLR